MYRAKIDSLGQCGKKGKMYRAKIDSIQCGNLGQNVLGKNRQCSM